MPHNFAHFTNEMVPFIDQLQAGEITADQFRQAMQNVETQQQDIVNNPIIGSSDFQDPLNMGTNTGALSNLTDNTETNLLLGDKQSGGVQLQDPNPTSVGTDYSQLQKGLGGVVAPKGYYFGPADGMYKYGEGPYADETKAYLDSVGMTFDEFSASQPQLSAMDPNVPEPVAEDLGPHGSPQPEPTKVFGSDYSLENLIGGQVERLYFKDPETGRMYDYDYDDFEFEYGIAPPKDLTGNIREGFDSDELQLIGAIAKPSGRDDTIRVDIDPTKYEFGGRFTPQALEQQAISARSNDKSDNDLFYTYNGRTYVDVSGTGQGIPVGATNITRDPTQLDLGDKNQLVAKDDPTTYTSPVLDKTFQGYVASGTSLDSEGKVITGQPDATDSFFESIGTNVPYDIGAAFGFDDNQNFVLSSPPSNRFNLEPFFNQAESQGLEPFVKSQQRDTLQMIKDGNFFTALAGGKRGDGDFISIDQMYPTATGVDGLNLVLDKLQGQGQFDDGLGIDPSFQLDAFDTDSDSQVSSITGDDEGTDPDEDADPDADPETPEETDPFTVRAFKGGGLGPYATNYMFQRFGYKPQQTIDLNLTYDPVEKLYFFEDGSPVDPKFLENMQLTKLDEDGNVVYDDEDNPVTMPKVVVNEDETTSEDE